MAIYHKSLQYHDDTTEKHELSPEDREFLLELQHEMNTQDTTGTSDPRFWVIKGSEKKVDDDNIGMYGLLKSGELVAEDTGSLCDYLNENVLTDFDCDRTECRIEEVTGYFDFLLTYRNASSEQDTELMTPDDLNDFLEEHGYDEYKVVGISTRTIIYPNVMFLTEKDAREHLEKNHYHYSDDAHTYCMHAWRSPVVERLWKILRETKW